ncbi:hypothetical protein ACWGTO_03985 [Mesorhizobium sp. PL10]
MTLISPELPPSDRLSSKLQAAGLFTSKNSPRNGREILALRFHGIEWNRLRGCK